jgi:hypothetical protein
MWLVENRTPFAAERAWVRDRNGAEVWLVAIKCTFDVQPDGTMVISDEQPAVLRAPEYHGEPGKSSIKFDTDLILGKTTTDICLLGHAYAPGGIPATRVDVGMSVGAVRKALRVSGDRIWGTFGASQAAEFLKMPLVYERASGGVDFRADPQKDWEWRNPVGTGFATTRDHLLGLPMPNIEYPDQLISSWDDRPQPAGFGPIGSHWQPRAAFAGTYDDHWMKSRQPLLPNDFDDRFYQCVPADQQAPDFLRGGEPVVLRGLTPSGNLSFVLPRIFLSFETHFLDGSRELHSQRRLHTVILEPDYPRVSLVWHTALPCHSKVQKLHRTVVVVKNDLTADRRMLEIDEAAAESA